VSIRDNIAYGRPDATHEGRGCRGGGRRADEFITELPEGYETVVGGGATPCRAGSGSGLALARTLLLNPPVLVLDDATSAIDVQVEQRILHGSAQPAVGQGPHWFIAHRLATIALADRVALIVDGTVTATGQHEEFVGDQPALRGGTALTSLPRSARGSGGQRAGSLMRPRRTSTRSCTDEHELRLGTRCGAACAARSSDAAPASSCRQQEQR